MKHLLMAIMAIAVAVTFSAPSFAGEGKKDKKDEKKGGQVLVYGDEKKKDKKDEKKGGHADTFGDKKDEKKKDEKGK
jgi:Ni/Co efflux regulator RcnB